MSVYAYIHAHMGKTNNKIYLYKRKSNMNRIDDNNNQLLINKKLS